MPLSTKTSKQLQQKQKTNNKQTKSKHKKNNNKRTYKQNQSIKAVMFVQHQRSYCSSSAVNPIYYCILI